MTDRSIIFSSPMIRALFDGRKTQTRRILKVSSEAEFLGWNIGADGPFATFSDGHHRLMASIGDRLWVKEWHWAYGHWSQTGEITKTGKPKRKFNRAFDVEVKFSSPDHVLPDNLDNAEGWYKRNSFFMHKFDSRLTLTVTDVRVQRVREISEEDAIAEGIEPTNTDDPHPFGRWRDYQGEADYFMAPQNSFRSLWNSVYGPNAWDYNDWVAAYTFTVENRNIDNG